MNNATHLEHRASSSWGKHEGESSLGLCDRLDRTRANSQRQLPTDHDYAVPTREYQTDQSSPFLSWLLLALSSGKQRQQQKQHLRLRRLTRSLHIRLTRPLHIRPDFTLHEIVRPKGLLSPHGLAGEDVIVIRCVDTLTAPAEKILCHVAVHGHRFGGGFRLAVAQAQDLMPDRTRYATRQVLKIDIASAKRQQLVDSKFGCRVE